MNKIIKAAVAALEDIKAREITVLDVRKLTALYDTLIIATADSPRQTKALAANLRIDIKALGGHVIGSEGEDSGEWVLVDCADFVVHIMMPAAREYYNLEELWSPPQPTREITVAKSAPQVSARKAPAAKKAAARKTPDAKKTPAKKVAAKKAATKLPAVKAPAVKTAATKKPAVKKVVTKKAVVKPPVVKTATKTAAKTAAKKPAVRKTSAVKQSLAAPATRRRVKAP